mmetsp:Transcript_32845/g.37647  ORF Transcript_32845/g.37647 Transcript_32845/m.37647 type:complete len:88 (+) Transcript_32845:488-751(+)
MKISRCAGTVIVTLYMYSNVTHWFDVFYILTSKVFLCTAATSWLDGKHVVFGKVISGLNIVTAIEQLGSDSGVTRAKVVITDSGQLR